MILWRLEGLQVSSVLGLALVLALGTLVDITVNIVTNNLSITRCVTSKFKPESFFMQNDSGQKPKSVMFVLINVKTIYSV